jgi:hypothetical protein
VINKTPTEYDELNAVLADLVERARVILGDDFVGAYLQGSFAVGDADMESDVDFIIPTQRPVTPEQEAALRDLHRELPARDGFWNKRIEGSYPPLDELRTLGAIGRDWLYIDNGHQEMTWSQHCNTEVVRWSLRECGITLAGPDPKTIIDEVPAEVLRAYARKFAHELLPNMETWVSMDLSWAQRYAVTTFCRILHTLDTGRVTSKRAALLWARDALDARWRPLIENALANRTTYWRTPSDPALVAETRAFADYATQRADASGPQ